MFNWKKALARKPQIKSGLNVRFRRVGTDIFPDHLIKQGGYSPSDFEEVQPTVEEIARMAQRVKDTKLPGEGK